MMMFRFFAAAVLAASMAAPAAAAVSVPAPIMTLASAVVNAGVAGDASALSKLYTSDAVVVDENPPYVWHGSSAGSAWVQDLTAGFRSMKMTGFKATMMAPTEFQERGGSAYLILPVALTGTHGAKQMRESGTLTFTFRKAGDTWQIVSQTWTTATMSDK